MRLTVTAPSATVDGNTYDFVLHGDVGASEERQHA